MSETRQYELAYVVSPDVGEDGVDELHRQVDEIVVGLGGKIEKTDNWGRRRLAYEIGKHKEGTYVIELIKGPGTLVSELDRRLKVFDSVLRHLVIRVDDDLRKANRARELRQSRQQRRRAARGMPPLDDAPPAAASGGEAGGPERVQPPATKEPSADAGDSSGVSASGTPEVTE